MLLMLLFHWWRDQDIINIHITEVLQNLVDEALEHLRCVTQNRKHIWEFILNGVFGMSSSVTGIWWYARYKIQGHKHPFILQILSWMSAQVPSISIKSRYFIKSSWYRDTPVIVFTLGASQHRQRPRTVRLITLSIKRAPRRSTNSP